MKHLLTLAFLLGSIAIFAQTNPIDGTWKGTRETPNGTFEITYSFKVDGSKLTGSQKSQMGDVELTDGKVDGKKFSYTLSFNERTIEFTGELVSDNEIVIKNQRGETKLTRSK